MKERRTGLGMVSLIGRGRSWRGSEREEDRQYLLTV
jgi:hypothetical protein